ncbi:MAG: ABC transporter permease [Phycisphaerales bacterium]|nr:ABC transporter permease [Phycisphaerales bacterium]
MSRLRQWREQLSTWQDRTKSRWILTACFCLIGVGALGPLWWSSYNHATLRARIAVILGEANIAERNPIAMQLVDRGSVTVDGVEIGSARIQSVATQMFDRAGKISEIEYASSFIAAAAAPSWAPVHLLEQPLVVGGVSLGLIGFSVLAIWVGMGIPFVLVCVVTCGVMVPFWLESQLDWMAAIGGVGFLIFAFLLLTRLALVLLTPAFQIFGLAHTVLLEALRLRISIAFITTLLVVLPMIPLWIDRREPLRYQVQTFISRGTSLVFVVAACLTLFLACATVAFEIRDRQIWNVLTKPVSRFQYLAGKLLGLSLLNGIVLLVGGFAVFGYVELMSMRPAADFQDAAAVQDQVLVAREVARPQYKSIDPARLHEIVQETIDRDSVLRKDIADGVRSETDVATEIRRTKTAEFMTAQRTIEAGQMKTFVFEGLQAARQNPAQPTLRYAFHIGRDSSHDIFPVLLSFGDYQPRLVNYVPVQRNVLAFPADAIDEDGTLTLQIFNGGVTNDGQTYPSEWSMNFDADGIEVLHRVGGFETNYLKAMLIDWARLIFIAALGVSAASVLSFPVAVLLSCTIFIAGAMSPFLALAMEHYYIDQEAPGLVQIFQYIIRAVVGFVRIGLAPFAQSGSATDLVDGRAISWWEVFVAIAQVGILWSVVVFSLGLASFSRKEIAIYSGGDG